MNHRYNVAQAGLPSAFDTNRPNRRQVHSVLHNGEEVGSFRNKVLADRLAATNPEYRVATYTL